MKKYQIMDCGTSEQNAGSKATRDVAAIARRLGYESLVLRMRSESPGTAAKLWRQAGYYADWKQILRRVEPGSLVLLQHPFHYPQLIREKVLRSLKERGTRFLCVVHDVEMLRGYRYNDYYKEEFDFMLEIADALVVHNAAMKEFFLQKGAPKEALTELGIFDYLQKEPPKELPRFARRVVIAGNLDIQKSAYIGQLGRLWQVPFDLYGGNYDNRLNSYKNIFYRGYFESDLPAGFLTSGLGLVWDGDSLCSCTGPSGEYLRFNNPHKLSLYLSCSLPVVIWKGAAEARLVEEQGAGICLDSLEELPRALENLGRDEYRKMAERAAAIGERLLAGEFMEKAIGAAEKRLGAQ